MMSPLFAANGPEASPQTCLDVFDFMPLAQKKLTKWHWAYLMTGSDGDLTLNFSASRSDIYGEYEVHPGDTLSAIAKEVTGGKLTYQKIFEANQDKLSDPDKIQVGQKLVIPNFD